MAERGHPEDPGYKGTIHENLLRARYAACLPFIADKDVLDVPCGTGWGASTLKRYRSLTCVDIDVPSVQYGRKHFAGIRFAAASMNALPFTSNCFDIVLCLEGIEHILRSEAGEFVNEAARVLRPDGTFIATVPLLNRGKHSGNPYHLYEYGEAEILDLFRPRFEPVQCEIRAAHDGPGLWFVGKRRPAPAPLVHSHATSALPLVERSVESLDSLRVDGDSHDPPDGERTLISTCLGILLLESAGRLGAVAESKRHAWIDFISGCQRADTGLFDDAVSTVCDPDGGHWQTTYFALHALDALDAPPRHSLKFVEAMRAPGALESWLESRNWADASAGSERVMSLLCAVIHRVEREGSTQDASILHRTLDWLDRTQNPQTGLWGTNRGSPLNAMLSGHRVLPFYEYVRRPVRSIPRIIDYALALQQSDGLFGGDPGGAGSTDLAALSVVATLSKYGGYRAADVRRALVRSYWATWNLMQQDDGSGNGSVRATWFRGLALATIAAALPADVPACPWTFRRWPALGYYRSAKTLTEHERNALPNWLRSATAPGAGASQARVTVVVTCYNLGEYLHEAIASALAQMLQPLRIIVVDDGSTDEFTRFLLDHFPYSGVELLRQENKGVAAARNAAITTATTEFICCLDADDKLKPEYLAKAVEALDSHPNAGFVSCYYELFDCAHDVYRYNDCRLPQMLIRNEAVISSVFRKSAWQAAGGYAEHLTGLHDWDLWIGMLENGYVGEVLPEVLFEYRARPGSMYSNTTKPSNYERLCREIARRHLRAYTDYAVDVLALKARQFIELVQLRSEERAYAEKEISRRERTIADQVKTISVINEAKNWLEGQAGSWQRAAEEGARAVQQLQQHAAGLWRQLLDARVEVEDLQRDKARLENRVAELEEQVADLQRQLTHTRVELARARLGRVRRGLRSASLLATPAMPLNARVRHLWWWWKMRRSDKCRRAWNELFDPDWYLDTHYDVGISGVAAELHYILVGHLENRSPSPRFDAAAYLAQRPDVRNAGVNPLLHYVLFGRE